MGVLPNSKTDFFGFSWPPPSKKCFHTLPLNGIILPPVMEKVLWMELEGL
ncbi:(S)-beta-bisabolene synthase [Caligus rogercresseyi]|uniref:(S)-beta-bisabolene synthase n=1 Tax=Caligus rogercresseyi TaxID=217165 RepID=A0A7T8QUH6_CALRO|nr:(S)-beta-bisabolene synthase [Caligus rogercresseyi]